MKKDFCSRLRELRGSTSQGVFAREIGIKQTTYSAWETGRSEPPIDMLCAISAKFVVSADWLLGLPERGGTAATITGNTGAVAIGAGAKATVRGKSAAPPDCNHCKYKQAVEMFKAL